MNKSIKSNNLTMNHVNAEIEALYGLVIDLVEYETSDCRILLREKGGDQPIAVIRLKGCFYFKDFGMTNCELSGFRIIDLGVKLHNLAERHGKASEVFHELHIWSNTESQSKYSNYKFTGITAAFETIEISHEKEKFFSKI